MSLASHARRVMLATASALAGWIAVGFLPPSTAIVSAANPAASAPSSQQPVLVGRIQPGSDQPDAEPLPEVTPSQASGPAIPSSQPDPRLEELFLEVAPDVAAQSLEPLLLRPLYMLPTRALTDPIAAQSLTVSSAPHADLSAAHTRRGDALFSSAEYFAVGFADGSGHFEVFLNRLPQAEWGDPEALVMYVLRGANIDTQGARRHSQWQRALELASEHLAFRAANHIMIQRHLVKRLPMGDLLGSGVAAFAADRKSCGVYVIDAGRVHALDAMIEEYASGYRAIGRQLDAALR